MNRIPPFISNTKDDLHCVPAVFKMVLKHYLNEDISFEMLDKIMKTVPGKGIWSTPAEIYLVKKGLRLKIIIDTDYEQLMIEGAEYFKRTLGKNTADYYINQSNFNEILPDLPEYIKSVPHDKRPATIEDVISALKEGELVATQVDSSKLNNKPGFSLHFVLLYDYSDGFFTLHDPGLPPLPSRKVTKEELEKSFNYDGADRGIIIIDKP